MNEADTSQPSSTAAPATPVEQVARGPVALVYSPHAGSVGRNQPQALLERAGTPVALAMPVSELDTGQPLGRQWREAGCVAAVAAGGDGTVGAVATHAASAGLPLGILPLGTANDVARALGIPLAPAAAARVIAEGILQRVDAGQAVPSQTSPRIAARQAPPSAAALNDALTERPGPQEPTADGAYFLHALTLGLNVEFARLATNVAQRRVWGRLTYAVAAIESLEHLKPIEVTLRFSGMPGAPEESIFVVRCKTAMLTAINLPIFGGRLGLRVPGIRTDDRLLDFIIVESPEPGGARVAFEAALGALTGAAQALWGDRRADATDAADARDAAETPAAAHPVQNPAGIALPGARWFRARAVEIETEQPVDLTLDGELRGRTPAVARVAPKAAHIIVPAARRA